MSIKPNFDNFESNWYKHTLMLIQLSKSQLANTIDGNQSNFNNLELIRFW